MIRVFLVDDHEIVRRGLADVIDRTPDMEVVGEAGTVRHAFGRIEALSPHVAILDVRLPDGSGIDLLPVVPRCCHEVQGAPPHRTGVQHSRNIHVAVPFV